MAELMRRYVVMSMAAEAPFDPRDPDGVFVLKPWKDPAALRALMTYRENCYPELSRDLEDWIVTIQAGPVVRGDVGRRNEAHMARAHTATAREPHGRARRPTTRAGAKRASPTRASAKRGDRKSKKRGR